MEEATTTTRKREIPIPPLSRADIGYHVIGVILNAGFTLWGMVWLVREWHALAPPWYTGVMIVLLGLFLSDFFSGLLHWGFDTWFTEESPLVRRVVLIVREHHVHPQHIFRYKFHYEAGTVSWASLAHTLPVVGAVTMIVDSPTPVGYSLVVVSVMVSVFTLFMLQFHKLGHRRTESPLLIALQKASLLMSAHHHGQHHRGNHDVKYCLVNGWADFVCDRTGFWRGVERAINWLTGAVPRSNDDQWMDRYRRRRNNQDQLETTKEYSR